MGQIINFAEARALADHRRASALAPFLMGFSFAFALYCFWSAACGLGARP